MLAPGLPLVLCGGIGMSKTYVTLPLCRAPRVSVVSSRPAFRVTGDVLNMYMADHTGASSGVGWPCFVRLAGDLTSLACGVVLARTGYCDGCLKTYPAYREGFGCLMDISLYSKPCVYHQSLSQYL